MSNNMIASQRSADRPERRRGRAGVVSEEEREGLGRSGARRGRSQISVARAPVTSTRPPTASSTFSCNASFAVIMSYSSFTHTSHQLLKLAAVVYGRLLLFTTSQQELRSQGGLLHMAAVLLISFD